MLTTGTPRPQVNLPMSRLVVTLSSITASNGGGGAIYSGVRYSSISLIKNTFSHNTAANCGAVQVSEPWFHYNARFIENIFIHNSAMGQPGGKNEGGGMCISKASAIFSDNTVLPRKRGESVCSHSFACKMHQLA